MFFPLKYTPRVRILCSLILSTHPALYVCWVTWYFALHGAQSFVFKHPSFIQCCSSKLKQHTSSCWSVCCTTSDSLCFWTVRYTVSCSFIAFTLNMTEWKLFSFSLSLSFFSLPAGHSLRLSRSSWGESAGRDWEIERRKLVRREGVSLSPSSSLPPVLRVKCNDSAHGAGMSTLYFSPVCLAPGAGLTKNLTHIKQNAKRHVDVPGKVITPRSSSAASQRRVNTEQGC